jgi:hypothetical protein
MILVRNVFQAKYGKGGELVDLWKEAAEWFPDIAGDRLLTDLSGPFFTIVTEDEFESFAEWEKVRNEAFSRPEFGEWFARMEPLVESGRREFYTIEEI